MTDTAKVTRYSWLNGKLDPLDSVELERASLHFRKAVEDFNTAFAQYESFAESNDEPPVLAEAISYSIDCMDVEITPTKHTTISGELNLVFSWHMTPQGQQFWFDMFQKYEARRIEEEKAKIKAIADGTTAASQENLATRREEAATQLAADEALLAELASPTPDYKDHVADHEAARAAESAQAQGGPPEMLPVSTGNDGQF